MSGIDLLQHLICHVFNESPCCLLYVVWFLLEGCFCVCHKIILCHCRYDACPHSLRPKQKAKIFVRVWLTEMSACFSYAVLAGNIVVEEVGVVLVYITDARLPRARQRCIYFFYFSVISLLVDLQIKPFRSSQICSATDNQSFRFSVRIFF